MLSTTLAMHLMVKPAPGDHNRTMAPAQLPPKRDTSRLTCYKCGKVSHIATDSKCLLYQKPKLWQIYAAQVVDNWSDTDQPDQDEP